MLSAADDEFVGGQRRCRDILWAILFVMCIVANVIIFFISLHLGSPRLLPGPETTNYENVISTWFTEEIAVLYHDLPIIALALVVSVILAFCWIQLLKISTRGIVASIILGLILSAVCVGIYTWDLSYRWHSTFFMFISIMSWIISFLIMLLTYAVRQKIAFTADVMRECGKVIQKVPILMAIPFLFAILYIVSWGFWLTGLVYLSSIPSTGVIFGSDSILYTTVFESSYRWLIWIQLLGGFWWFSFLSACEQYIVARVVHGQQESHAMQINFRPLVMLSMAMRESVFYSLGSLAVGGLVCAIAELMSTFIKYSGVTKRIDLPTFCCGQSCVTLAQSVIQWTNGFSYVYIAIGGYSFRAATQVTFQLMTKGFSKLALASLMVNYLLFLGNLFFTLAITGITIATIEHYHYHIGFISVLVTAFSVYLLFHLIGRLILIVVNTLLVLLLENQFGNTLGRSPLDLVRVIQQEVDNSTGNAVYI